MNIYSEIGVHAALTQAIVTIVFFFSAELLRTQSFVIAIAKFALRNLIPGSGCWNYNIGCSKKNSEKYQRKCFWTEEKETQINI